MFEALELCGLRLSIVRLSELFLLKVQVKADLDPVHPVAFPSAAQTQRSAPSAEMWGVFLCDIFAFQWRLDTGSSGGIKLSEVKYGALCGSLLCSLWYSLVKLSCTLLRRGLAPNPGLSLGQQLPFVCKIPWLCAVHTDSKRQNL